MTIKELTPESSLVRTKESSEPSPHGSSRIEELDGLRGLAVLAVVGNHYLAWLPAVGSGYGWLGVDLFFVLSGFLITSILLNLRGQENYFRTFYARRALRIFPPYFIGIAVYLGISIMCGKPGSLSLWSQYIFYYTSLFVGQPPQLRELAPPVALGLAVLWSLSVEEIYYTIWAPIVRFSSQPVLLGVLAAMCMSAPISRFLLHSNDYPELFTFYCRMDCLAYGSLVALLIRQRRQGRVEPFAGDRVINVLACTVIPITLLFWLITHGDRSSRLVATVGLVLADVSLGLVLYSLIRRSGGSGFFVRKFRFRWLRSIGMVSYSLYLFHYPVWILGVAIVDKLHEPRRITAILQVLVSFGISLAIAYGLWYAVESRILRWKDRYVPG